MAGQRRKVGLLPDSPTEAYLLAALPFFASGSAREADELFARLTPAQADSPRWLDLRKTWARCRGNFAEAIRLDRLQPYFDDDGTPHWEQAAAAAIALAAQGDRAGARARLGSFPAQLRAQLELEPEDPSLWSGLARMEMLLDHPEEALRCARKATVLVPVSLDAMVGPTLRKDLACVLAWTGDKAGANEELTGLLRAPIIGNGRNNFLGGGGNVHEMKFGPEFFPLRGDPRFEALLADPKNNAPLF